MANGSNRFADGEVVPAARVPASTLATQRNLLAIWLVLTDAVALGIAFRIAYWVRFDLGITLAPEVVAPLEGYQGLSVLLIPIWLLTFVAFNLYDPQAKLAGIVESSRTFNACTAATMVVILSTFLFPSFVVSRMWVVSVWALSFVLVAANRFLARRLVYIARTRGFLLSPAVIVGSNEEANSLIGFLDDPRSSGLRILGLIATNGHSARRAPLPVLGTTRDVQHVVREHGVEDVIVAITALDRDELLRLSEDLDALPIQLRLSSGLYELLTTRVDVHTLGTVPFLTLQKHRLSREEVVLKTVLDWSVVLLGLAVLWPLFIAIALWVKLDSPGPVLYRRRVVGVSKRPFDALKFRTMFVNGHELLSRRDGAAEELHNNHKLKDDPRVTRAGRWLRRFSLDELPQLFNVLLGQMSLVGPRMIAPEELEKYGRHGMNLLTVKPGITGLWQVSGRSDLSYEDRVRIDMYYVRNYSIWMDLQILFVQTPPAVLRGRGAY